MLIIRVLSILWSLVLLGFMVIGCEKNPLQSTTETSSVARVVPSEPNSYIVVFKESVKNVPEVASEMARTHGAAMGFTYEHAIKGFSATIPEARLAQLKNDPRVESVEPDLLVTAFQTTIYFPWGIDKINAEPTPSPTFNGSGVRIYIIDTGIGPHSDLNIKGGISYVPRVKSYSDDNGHGTHVAGTTAAISDGFDVTYNGYNYNVVGAAYAADLYAVKVLDKNGSGQLSWVIAGVDYVTAAKVKSLSTPMVANMSLGVYTGSTSYTALDTAVKKSISMGVVYAIAAGNDGKDAKYSSPAHVVEAITVGAYGPDYKLATWSNWGTIVDLNAPGVGILSTWKGGGYNMISGTSMAAPHVAGTAALYLSNPSNKYNTAEKVRNDLVTAATENWDFRVIDVLNHDTTNLSVYAGSF